MLKQEYCCKGDRAYHYKSELPTSLRPYADYIFSSGGMIGDDFKSFNTKYKNAIKKMLPDGYTLYDWHRGHYECSAFIKDNRNRLIYLSIPDVRYYKNEWFSNILIRTAAHEKDYSGGMNHHTTLFTITKDIQKLYMN